MWDFALQHLIQTAVSVLNKPAEDDTSIVLQIQPKVRIPDPNRLATLAAVKQLACMSNHLLPFQAAHLHASLTASLTCAVALLQGQWTISP
jgi:hypothetical protein